MFLSCRAILLLSFEHCIGSCRSVCIGLPCCNCKHDVCLQCNVLCVCINLLGAIHCQLCKKCRHCLSQTSSTGGHPNAVMPPMARANGMWRGSDPKELSRLSYCEAKVINLARVYVSVKRLSLDRASYAGTYSNEAPLYHQRNVVAYPQNPDTALRTLGMSPFHLARTLQVQFVGSDRSFVRSHPDLQVSIANLRAAFHWLSLNSWPFMEHNCCKSV